MNLGKRPTRLLIAPALAAAGFALGLPDAAAADTYDFNDQGKRNTASFVLDAPFESIHAVANGVEGTATIDGRRRTADGQFRVRVDSIRTGNDTRDEHLQNDKWLDAKRWPHVEFSFTNLKLPASYKNGKTHRLKARGELYLHGVRRKATVPVSVRYFAGSEMTKKRLPGNLVRIKSDFDIRLEDYGVAQSDSFAKSLIGLKVGEVAEVKLDFWGTDVRLGTKVARGE